MSCISRRAHADRHSFKLIKEVNEIIIEKNYIWTEYKCPNEVINGKDFCSECCNKVIGFKYQQVPKFDHGIVGGPYTAQSKLYGSLYYLKFIKAGWKIKEEDERRAKDLQQKANMAPKKTQTTPKEGGVQNTPIKLDDSGSTLTIKTSIYPSSPSSNIINETPKKPRKAKVVKTPMTPVLSIGVAEFVESIDIPKIVTDVIVVKVKKIRCSGTDYYYDSKSGKVYGVSTKGVGAYKGRYSPEEDMVDSSYPDSDDE
jgi:hypothetical protein